jgi:hypothetical protein
MARRGRRAKGEIQWECMQRVQILERDFNGCIIAIDSIKN